METIQLLKKASQNFKFIDQSELREIQQQCFFEKPAQVAAPVVKQKKVKTKKPKFVPTCDETLELDITNDMYVGELEDDELEKFNCLLCFGTVFKPLKCDKCSYLYCARCIPDESKAKGKFRCFRKCGSKTNNCIEPSQEELTVLKNMTFNC